MLAVPSLFPLHETFVAELEIVGNVLYIEMLSIPLHPLASVTVTDMLMG